MSTGSLSVIVTNARVRTGDPAHPWATALGLSRDTLAVVGSAAEILKMADNDTRVFNARGQTLTLAPGSGIGTRMNVTTDADGSVRLNVATE